MQLSLYIIEIISVIYTYLLKSRFHHPKTEITSTFHPKIPLLLGEKVKLQNVGCKLQFISAINEIKQLLLSFPLKISIYKVEGSTKTCISESKIDTKELFCQNKVIYHIKKIMFDTYMYLINVLNKYISG